MQLRLFALCAAFACAPFAATSAAEFSIQAEVDGIGMEASSETSRGAVNNRNASCAAQCNSAHARCSSEVRRARQQCSRTAATGSRDAFDSSQDNASLFCGYFRRPRNCGPGCQARFAQHFQVCMKALDNPARMRGDCMEQERQAQRFCRDELHACELACRS